jgi:hypothetical protein
MKKSSLLALATFCAAWLISLSAAAYQVEVLQNSGAPANRIDLVIMGDGYRSQDQAKLTADATSLVNTFFAQPTFAAYRNYYNVKLVHVISNQDGADNGDVGPVRDTALGAYFNCSGIDRLLCVDDFTVLNVATQDAPDFDQILVVVNDTKYGGAGGSQIATTSIAPGAADIPVHEVGHSLFSLADEYDTPTPGFPHCDTELDCPEANASVFSDRARVKWSYWIDASTPLPTPDNGQYDNAVGAFAGSRYFFDQYRPWANCLMRSLGTSFCPVCSEAGVLTTYSYVDPIDSVSPSPSSPVSIPSGQTVTFTVSGPLPTPSTLSYVWTLDGAPLMTTTLGSLTVSSSQIGSGQHALAVTVRDTTTRVRRDPSGLLQGSQSWSVTGASTSCTPVDLPRVAAAASSQETAQYPASAAIDASTTTRWSSLFTDPQWLYVDLGQARQVTGVDLLWEAAASSDFDLEIAASTSGPWTKLFTGVASAGLKSYVVSGSGRYVRMYSRHRTTQWGNSIFDFKVKGYLSPTGCSCQNQALQRVAAVASSSENANFPASSAIDGNTTTRWSSLFSDPQWLYVDLGAPRFIKRVKLTWEAAASRDYDIAVSNSTSGPWQVLTLTTTGDGGVDDYAALSGSGRYVRMYSRARTTPYGNSLFELEVFGDTNPACTP